MLVYDWYYDQTITKKKSVGDDHNPRAGNPVASFEQCRVLLPNLKANPVVNLI